MFLRFAYCVLLLSGALTACDQTALPAVPTAVLSPTPIKTGTPPPVVKIQLPVADAAMTKVAEDLVFESEVGGEWQYKKWPHPGAPDARLSGVTEGLGYDNAENAASIIKQDWSMLAGNAPTRLAATHPYRGKSAQQHVHEVVDITVSWENAYHVFYQVDLPRVDGACRRAYPGFDALRPKAKDAIRSLVFNRGTAMSGPTRTEMRDMKDAIAKQDYARMAGLERAMCRVWKGTSIERGMTTRRYAEAKLIETP